MLESIKSDYNTVIIIEHDLQVIKQADQIIEMGPGAGAGGGEVIYQGNPEGLKDSPQAKTKWDHCVKINKKPKIIKKISTLEQVGLNYLTLGQTTSSLSGGEVQRLKLASHLKEEGEIYLLDEPSLGLHASDNEKLLDLFQKLVNNGNSVIIIEHNLDFIASSDWLVELGPEGGKKGGYVIFEGRPEDIIKANTPTGRWLNKEIEP